MLKKQRFYTMIIFICLGLSLGGITSCSLARPPDIDRDSGELTTVVAGLEARVYLNSFANLRGTKYFVAEAVSTTNRSFSYDRGSGLIYNMVFLDSETLDSWRLFPANTQIIYNNWQFPTANTTLPLADQPLTDDAIQWLVYLIISQDTDQDEDLDGDDLKTLAVSDVAGQNYSEVLTQISDLRTITMLNVDELLLIYTQDGRLKASHLNLTTRSLGQTKEIVGIK